MWSLAVFLYIVWLTCSVCWDLYSYEDRQKRWERAHPGATYIRGYRRFEKQSDKLRRMGGML